MSCNAFVFEEGMEYYANEDGLNPIKVIKRTPKMIMCTIEDGSPFRMKIRTDKYGNEYAFESCTSPKWRDAMTYQAMFKVQSHYVGEIVMHGEHECVVTAVWYDDEANKDGITIKPTGNYGFEVDIYDDQL